MSTRNEPDEVNRPDQTKQPEQPDEPTEPNEEGFAGAATAPEPRIDRRREDEKEEEAQEAAIPDSDLTKGISESLPEADEPPAPRPDNR